MAVTPLAFACGAAGGDNREPVDACDEAGASVHPPAGPAASTGNPVDLITGNKYLRQLDARWPGGLTLVRHYNSRNASKGALGPGWRHSFDTRLFARHREGRFTVQIVQGDGRRIVFRSPAKGESAQTILQALPSDYGTVKHQPELAADRRWVWRWREGSALYFSERGLLTSVERANGQRLKLTYEGQTARLLEVSNRHRQSLRFEYEESNGRLRRVLLPDQQDMRYQYDAVGVLTKVTRGKEHQWSFEHADHLLGGITAVRNALGEVTARVRYNPQGRAVYSSLGGGAEAVELSYDLPSTVFEIGKTDVQPVDSPGQTTRWQWRYDPVTQQRQLLSSQGPGCSVCPASGITSRFDDNRRLVQQQYPRGDSLSYQYDKRSRLSRLVSQQDPDRAVFSEVELHYQSEAPDALLSQIDRSSIASGKTHSLKFERDSLGRIVRVIESGYEPDLSTLTNLQGENPRWRIEQWRPLQRQWAIEYVPFGPAAGLPWQVDGPLPGLKDAARYVYDQAGRPTTRLGPHRRQVNWHYNLNGLLATTVSDGTAVESRQYDKFNRVIERVARGIISRVSYDAAGRRIQLAASNRPTLNLVRDQNGQIVALKDSQSRELTVASILSGALNLKGPTTGPSTVVKTALPDIEPALELITHARGIFQRRKSATGESDLTLVDDFGRVVARFDSETGIERFVYDEADRPVARVDGAGNVSQYFYHENGSLERVSNLSEELLRRSYEEGALKAESQRYQIEAFKRDAHGRMTARSVLYHDPVTGQGFDKALELSRSFDAEGRLKSQTVGLGYSLQYTWSDQSELTGLALVNNDGQTRVLADSLKWQPFAGGQRGFISGRLGNGLTVDWKFDKQMWPIEIRHQVNAKEASSPPTVRYTYGPSGKISNKTVGPHITHYEHDELGRLIASKDKNGTTTYRHSAASKELQRQRSQSPRVLKISDQKASAEHSNRTHWYKSPTGSQVALDSNGRPQWTLTTSRSAWRYLYNIKGERIGKLNLTDPSQSRWFIYDNQRLMMETDVIGNPVQFYVWLDGRPLALIDLNEKQPSIQWIHTDAIGLPISVSDESARLLWQGSLDPWGTAMPAAAEFQVKLRFPGQLYDAETGLHDNYLRTYDPSKRQYLGPDPLGIRARGNRYAYSNHSPLDTTDPLGLYEIDMHYYATLVIALAAGMTYEEARIVAHANQYVDNGVATQPIRTGPDGRSGLGDLVDTGLTRQQVLRDWHFVLDEENPNNANIGNPSSHRLTVLENWVDSAPDRMTQMFNLGVYSHPYLDTAAHRDENNVPYPPTRWGFAVGHAHDVHHPDYTYNHCQEFPVVVVDGNNPEQPPVHNVSWNHNESRTLAIQEGLYQVYRRYAGREATVSWEDLQVMLREFNAIHESQDPDSPRSTQSIDQKLRTLESFLRQQGIRTGGDTPRRIDFVSGVINQNSVYDRRRAALYWSQYFSNPGE
ncbi:MAG: DUF6765 family protein [Burkholderiaceae bacterium]